MELPDSYKPGSLNANHNSRKEIVYAIGIEHEPNSFGMTHGPHTDIKEMLEVCPTDRKSVIIRFNLDGTDDLLYRWNETNETWIKNNLPSSAPVQILSPDIVEKIRERIQLTPDGNLKDILFCLLDSHEELRRLLKQESSA
jgi:hypothetical protein